MFYSIRDLVFLYVNEVYFNLLFEKLQNLWKEGKNILIQAIERDGNILLRNHFKVIINRVELEP